MTAITRPTELLGMFAKFWQRGAVKTRLAHTVGPEQACVLHHAFVMTLLQRLRKVTVQRQLCFTPTDRQPEFSRIADHQWSLVPQSEGDLGERMKHFFVSA